jgi:hypothetical protein
MRYKIGPKTLPFIHCCVLDRVYRAVAWQRFDEICYSMLVVVYN